MNNNVDSFEWDIVGEDTIMLHKEYNQQKHKPCKQLFTI